MSVKILFVDDDPNVLAGYQRQMRKAFTVETALGSVEGLTKLVKEGPYAVVVADMCMPQMNGATFLNKAMTLSPHTVRIMLTGNSGQQTAMDAVNEGHIFRFLTKPCSPEVLTQTLEGALEQYRLVKAETELLEKTLLGSINLLTEMLMLADPVRFGRARTLRDHAREVAPLVEFKNRWELELAALFSPIGYLTLPAEILAREHQVVDLTAKEKEVIGRVPEIGHNLLTKIPRLGGVAQIVRYQSKHYNGAGPPVDSTTGENIPLGARVLKILMDMMQIEAEGKPRSVALRLMRNRGGWYDTKVLNAITNHFAPALDVLTGADKPDAAKSVRKRSKGALEALQALAQREAEGPQTVAINFEEILIGDVLASDLCASDGSLLLSAGYTITQPVMESLKNHSRLKGVMEPIYVVVSEE